jgi:hypothetical protein
MHSQLKRPFRQVRLLTVAAALAAATSVAACGSSSSPTVSASSASSASAPGSTSWTLAFSKCMRANGVPNFPDLSGSGMLIEGSGQTISVNGISINAPAYQAARAKCQHYMPTRTAASPAQQAQQHARGLKFAKCMRTHGVPNFPDPQVVSSQGGNQEVRLRGINTQSPAFQTAAKACGGGPKGP